MANPVSVPNVFVAATDAVAAEVNANFNSLVDYINDHMVTDDGTVEIGGTQTVTNLIVSGTLTAQGNLDVDGTLKGDVVASNGTSVVLSNGTNGSNATFKGDILDASGTTIVDVSAATFAGNATTSSSTTGNAATASEWLTARTLTLSGDVTGNVSIDGSQDVTLTTTVGNDSHTHNAANLTGNTLASGVTASSLTSVGTLTSLNVSGALDVDGLLNVSGQAKIEFGNATDQIRYDDTDNQFEFWMDGSRQCTLGNPSIRMHHTDGTLIADSPPPGTGNDAEWSYYLGTNVLYQNTSVAADKENISADLGTHLTADMIDSVVPKMWNRITAPGIPEIGPIADEVDEVSPFLAAHGTDATASRF